MTPHWTDEQLISHFYGIGPDDRHVETCAECRARLYRMQLQRQAIDRDSALDGVSLDLLAAQRRKIHERIAEPATWWSRFQLRRWASAAAAVMVLAGGALLVENNHKPAAPDTISDAQLAQDVSRMAEDPEPTATAPLQSLFLSAQGVGCPFCALEKE